MIDKQFCMSSYLAFRYIERDDVVFFDNGKKHRNFVPVPDEKRIFVHSSDEIDMEIGKQIQEFQGKKKGIMLSGGMDSAIVASYLTGADAYTFRFLGGEYQKEELQRAEYYAQKYGLHLHYVDITWDTVIQYLEPAMKGKAAPVHSIDRRSFRLPSKQRMMGLKSCLSEKAATSFLAGWMDFLQKTGLSMSL